MADLFTTLAQEQPATKTVRPRSPALFEDGRVDPFSEPQEAPPPQSLEISDQARELHEPREADRENESSAPAAGQTTPGSETIRETTEAAGDSAVTADRQAYAAPIQPQAPPPAMTDQVQPTTTDSGRLMAPTIQPLPPAGKPDTPDPREPALAPLIPAALEDGLDTIRPAAVEAAAPVDTRQPPAIKEAAQGVTQPAQPQIRPASPATDFDAAVSGTAGVDQAPTIEIHIGRVELRQAAPVTQQTPPVRSRFEPPLSLNAYLERRNGGGE